MNISARNLISTIFLSLILIVFYSSLVQARWATYEDAATETIFYNQDITIQADGKAEYIMERKVKILNEKGREWLGTQSLNYNGNTEKIQVIEAKTIYQGKEYVVPKDAIETKPLASDYKAFDQLYQVLISYPQAVVGAEVYLKYKLIINQQPLPNFYSNYFAFGQNSYQDKSTITIKSKLALNVAVNDLRNLLSVKQEHDKNYKTKLIITQKKPIYESLVNEPASSIFPENQATWVTVTSYNAPDELARGFAPDFEKVAKQPLPALFESIKESAKAANNDIDQINMVTSSLAEKIRYMGDWRTISGKFAPRDLAKIVESQVGDCKDFATVTAAILSSLGFKAQITLVHRGEGYLAPKSEIIVTQDFNHAMVKVEGRKGELYWIDPTNLVSMAGGVFPDIANRPVAVLSSTLPSYEHIPNVNYQHSKLTSTRTMDIKENSITNVVVQSVFAGEQALFLAGQGLFYSPKVIEEWLIRSASGEIKPLDTKVKIPDLTSRIVKDIMIDLSFKQEGEIIFTNSGVGIPIDSSWYDVFFNTSDEQVGDIFIGTPATIVKNYIIENVDAKDIEKLNFVLETPWLKAKRSCVMKNGNAEIKEQIEILKSFISAEEIKSKQYQNLKSLLKKEVKNVALIVSKRG